MLFMEGGNIMEVMTKQCIKCKEVKGVGEFFKRKTSKDGLQARCKKCTKEGMIKYQKQCETCGKDFESPEKNAKYCSRTCSYIVERFYDCICVNCKKTFPSKISLTKYCSKKCKDNFTVELNEKKCFKCGLTKKIDEFYKQTINPTGRTSRCIECTSEYRRQKNREKKLKEYMESIGYEEPDKSIPADIDLEEIKTCVTCKEDKPLKDYHYNYYKETKKSYFVNSCKSCANERRKENYHKRELEKLREMRARGRN